MARIRHPGDGSMSDHLSIDAAARYRRDGFRPPLDVVLAEEVAVACGHLERFTTSRTGALAAT